MAMFFGSFAVFVLAALGLGISVLFIGRPMDVGCSRTAPESGCKSIAQCAAACDLKS